MGWFDGLGGLLAGGSALGDDDKRALINQGLLAMGAGILANNKAGNGSAAMGQGISQGLLAMNRGADDLAERKYRQMALDKSLASQNAPPAQQRFLEWLLPQLPEGKRQSALEYAAGVESRPSSAGFGFGEQTDAYGNIRPKRNNPRNGNVEIWYDEQQRWVPLGATPQPSVSIGQDLPPEVQAYIRQNEPALANAPDGTNVHIPTFTPAPVPGLGRGRSKEREAGAVTAAQESARLGYAPAFQAIETQGAVQRAAGTAAANAEVDRDTQARQKAQALAQFEAAKKGLMDGLSGTETGPIVGRLPAVTTGQQVAEGAIAAMAPILKQIFRVAGEGTFTDRDQALLMEMLPTRKDLPEAAAAKLHNIDGIIKTKLGGSGVRRYNPATGKIE